MKSVLVVEDDLDLRTMLEGVIGDLGYSVVCASDGREALSVLRSGISPRLILLDLMMPVLDGWQFRAEQINDPRLSRIPTVVMSASGNLVNTAIDADELLPKPIRVDLLQELLRRFVGAPANSSAAFGWQMVTPGEGESSRWRREDGFWIAIVIDGDAGRVSLRDSAGACEFTDSYEAALEAARGRRA